MEYRKLSIVMPVFNEEKTLEEIVDTVIAVKTSLETELIIIDDCSTDETGSILQLIVKKHPGITLIRNEKNRGKGFSVRRGIEAASGDIIIIQDADLELDPNEYPRLLKPILENRADVVYGSRFVSMDNKMVINYWHYLGNKILTTFSNMASNLNLSDMETCYKTFRADIIKNLRLTEDRFGFEPEVTYKLSRIKKLRICEVGISYYGRSYDEGKKINWKDGIRVFYVIIKCMFIYFFKREKSIFINPNVPDMSGEL